MRQREPAGHGPTLLRQQRRDTLAGAALDRATPARGVKDGGVGLLFEPRFDPCVGGGGGLADRDGHDASISRRARDLITSSVRPQAASRHSRSSFPSIDDSIA